MIIIISSASKRMVARASVVYGCATKLQPVLSSGGCPSLGATRGLHLAAGRLESGSAREPGRLGPWSCDPGPPLQGSPHRLHRGLAAAPLDV